MEIDANVSQTLSQKRDELYRAARAHPGSPEDEMVEILLLSAMSKMDPAPYDATAGRVLGHERRRFQTTREPRAHERRAPGGAEGAESQPQKAADEASVAELRQELEKKQERLEKIEEALEAAKEARAAGKQMTDLEIYNRIAAVVGLTPPAETAERGPLPEGQHREWP